VSSRPTTAALFSTPATWYLSLASGVIPLLVLGFVSSALANRLAFVAWGIAAAALYAVVLRRSFERGTSAGQRLAAPCLVLGAAILCHAWLHHQFGEELGLAFRAFLPKLYHPTLTRPGNAAVVGCGLSLAAGLIYFRTRTALRRSP